MYRSHSTINCEEDLRGQLAYLKNRLVEIDRTIALVEEQLCSVCMMASGLTFSAAESEGERRNSSWRQVCRNGWSDSHLNCRKSARPSQSR
ncbi:hypothetical protein F183_A39260 [Bryobacterales bacterium F-183]|nr:hypothetical protein F183_A39260 [Bryobacterales bacterium F-183]